MNFYHGSNSSKLRLVILIGVRNNVLLFDCHERTLGHLVLPVLLLGCSRQSVFGQEYIYTYYIYIYMHIVSVFVCCRTKYYKHYIHILHSSLAKLFYCFPFAVVSFCFCSSGNLSNEIPYLIIALHIEPISAFLSKTS